MAKKTKFFTVAGFTRFDGEVDPWTFPEVFKTRRAAAKFIAEKINEVLHDYDEEHREVWDCVNDVTAKDCLPNGYRLSFYNAKDDISDLTIVEHSWEE